MAVKLKYGAKTDIPAEFQSLYVERDGAFFLDVEGAVEKARLDEFRNNNLALQREIDALKEKYKGIDPQAIAKLEEDKRKAEEARALKDGQIDQIVASRVKPFQDQLQEHKAAQERLLQELSVVKINNAAISAATKRGMRATAIPDLTSRARAVFRLDNNGNPVPYIDGAVRYGKDGTSPMTVDEWAEGLVQAAPHLFESSAGSGAASQSSGGAQERNPWAKEHWNLTRQGEIFLKDPAKAEQLKRSAGKR